MAKPKRHYIPGQIWHITHRCHKREIWLKFAKDRRRYLDWLFNTKKCYGFVILNYTVTLNHIHLLVVDDMNRDVIPDSIKLVAGLKGRNSTSSRSVLSNICQSYNQHSRLIANLIDEFLLGRSLVFFEHVFVIHGISASYFESLSDHAFRHDLCFAMDHSAS